MEYLRVSIKLTSGGSPAPVKIASLGKISMVILGTRPLQQELSIQCGKVADMWFTKFILMAYGEPINEEPEEPIRYAALIHNSVMTATSTEQRETSCLVNDAFGTTSWLFHDVTSHSLFFTELCIRATFCVCFHAGSSLQLYWRFLRISHTNGLPS
jgi:hypothetical protein